MKHHLTLAVAMACALAGCSKGGSGSESSGSAAPAPASAAATAPAPAPAPAQSPAASPAPAPATAASSTPDGSASSSASSTGGTATASASGGAADGQAVYSRTCVACHGAGVAGAPKVGDKAAWGPRIAQGKDTLYTHALQGYQGKNGVMPPKGGNAALSDAEVKAAVDYMVGQAS